MARGWESKSVESQIEAAEARPRVSAPHPDAAELKRTAKRDSLLLSRRRVVNDLEHARNPGYQRILRDALAHLDRKLADLL